MYAYNVRIIYVYISYTNNIYITVVPRVHTRRLHIRLASIQRDFPSEDTFYSIRKKIR